MSSYVTSPFVLEQRRLQGVLNQCCADLENALQEVAKQQEIMRRQEDKQRRQDAQYFASQRSADEQYQRSVAKKEADHEQKRSILESRMQAIEIQLGAIVSDKREWQGIIERQNQLMQMVHSPMESLEDLEQYIEIHEEQIRVKSRQVSAEQYGKATYESGHLEMKRSRKGVSLQMEVVHVETEKIKQRPLDIFVSRMKAAMASKYSNRFPSLIQLKKEFDSKPEYMKAFFAVHNMKKLEEILKQIEYLEKNAKEQSGKREEIILQYRAVCKMMGIQADERLIEDERSSRKIVQISEDFYKKYQERKKQQYVSSAIAAVMERHGIVFQDSTATAWGDTLHFAMDHAQVDISGTENNQLTMEVYGKYEGAAPTLDDRRKSVASANKMCSLLQTIETELREEYGIIFGEIITEDPSEEAIVMKKAAGRHTEKKYIDRKNKLTDAL